MVPRWSSIDDRSKVMHEITMMYEAFIRNSILSSAMYNYKACSFLMIYMEQCMLLAEMPCTAVRAFPSVLRPVLFI